jgi:hypothetical protein
MCPQPGPTGTHILSVLLGVWACWLSLPVDKIDAAEAEAAAVQRELEEAKAEDEADRAKGEGYSSEKTYTGRLVLGQVAEGRPDIVGLFTIEKGKAYPVKLANEGLMDDLKQHNHETIALQGKFRNQGQYFVVTAIIPPPAPTQSIDKLGGL